MRPLIREVGCGVLSGEADAARRAFYAALDELERVGRARIVAADAIERPPT